MTTTDSSDTEAPAGTEAPAPATGGAETTAPARSGGGGEGKTVGLLFDITGRGDKSFNDAAAAGLDQAVDGVRRRRARESTPTGDGDRAERLDLLVGEGNDLVIGVGFLWSRRPRRPAPSPTPTSCSRSSTPSPSDDHGTPDDFADDADCTNVASLRLRRGAGLVPRRRGRRAQEPDRQDRLHRWRRDRPDQEVRGRLHRRRQGRQPGHRDPVAVHHPAAGLHRLQRPGQGQGDRRVDVRRRRRRRLRRGRRLRPRRVRGRQRGRRARRRCGRSASTATSTTWSTPALQPYILTSMLKRVDVAVYETIEALRRRRRSAGGVAGVRPRRRRRRLLDVGWLRRRHRRPARRLQGSRSSTARSRSRPTP